LTTPKYSPMPSKLIFRQFANGIPKLPLRFVLVVPFLIQIFAAVGLTGWLSFRNGSSAVNDLATQLQVELNHRIQQELNTYLEMPHLINKINVDAIRQDLINLDQVDRLEGYLWNQMQQFPTASYIGIGTSKGEYVGANRYDDGSIEFDILTENTDQKLQKWLADSQGNRTELVSEQDNYDPRNRPWYEAATYSKQQVWSEIYAYFGSKALVVSANQPIYDQQGNLLGVASTDLTLERISEFLSRLKIGKTGQTFVMERNGVLVATSTLEDTFTVISKNSEPQRLKAVDSRNLLTHATAEYLIEHFGSLENIQTQTQLTFQLNGRREFLQVTPLSDSRGIDWLIVMVVPESDFMQQINANTRLTILLCIAALILATGFGILTTRWIAKPILRLSEASQAIARGAKSAKASSELHQKVTIESIEELGILASSFNTMTQQLQESFITLEQRVEERTAELRQEKERSEQLLLNILPKAIADQLKKDQKAIASAIEEVTILFADIVGFTPLSARIPPIELVSLLNEVFSIFDQLADKYKLEKIKTIGDAYMVVGGLPLPQANHAEAIADMALEMQAEMNRFQTTSTLGIDGLENFQIRIGINTGSVVAGVIGIKKFIYDLWGDAVNIASRMESSGSPGCIQVTEATYERLKDEYYLEKRGLVEIKGKGKMNTYWLLKKQDNF